MEPGLRLSAPVTLGELALRHGGEVDPEAAGYRVSRVAPVEEGRRGDLCPLLSRRHLSPAQASASALLVDASIAEHAPRGARWVHRHAMFALAGVLAESFPEAPMPAHDERALIDPGAEVAKSAVVFPFAVVMAGARVGEGCVIEPHAVIYPRVRLGARVVVSAGAVIGRPGFGWAHGPSGEVRRIPQLGGVWVEDDVEIGPLSTIDAGTLGPTVLAKGVRIDAHVHVGHNVRLGEGTMVAAQSGFAGSVRIGPDVLVGGQVGVADHVTVGPGARIAAKAGVIGDVPAGDTVAGYPAVGRARWLRGVAFMLLGGRRNGGRKK